MWLRLIIFMPEWVFTAFRMSSVNQLLQATAITIDKQLGSGRNKPVLGQCEITQGGDKLISGFVIKLRHGSEMALAAESREVIASLLAQHFGIRVPDPACIEILQEVAEGVTDLHLKSRVLLNVGRQFGSRYIEGSPIFTGVLTDKTAVDATNIFAFDMLIQNVDRQVRNPNLFEAQDGLIAFDHEMAFGFADPTIMKLAPVSDPWDFTANNVKRHALLRCLKGRSCIFDSFIDQLTALSDEVIWAICDQVPVEWRTGEIENIAQHLQSARIHSERFKRSLQEVVS